MGRKPTTRLELSGYRFLVRRMEHALVRGDIRMLDDPLRGQSLSLIAGAGVAAIIVAVCAVLAFLRPLGALDAAPIVMDRDSGALYVRIGDTWHPVSNLASARLIVGSPDVPRAVHAGAITAAKRGPQVGIAGAPATIGEPLSSDEISWAICDSASTTTLIVGRTNPQNATAGPDSDGNVLVTDGSATYLIYDGWRARVDLRDATVVRVLGLEGVVPRPVSPALLQSVPEAPPIAVPRVAAAGSPGLAGFTVGTVVRLERAHATEYYVVLAGAVQRIGEVAADLIRFTVAQPAGDIRTVAADTIAVAHTAETLPVGTFPRRTGVVDGRVLCAGWAPHGGSGRTNTSITVGDSLPVDGSAAVVELVQADGDGPAVDAFAMPAGRSAYVRSAGVTGDGGVGGSLFMLTDFGVLFGVRDADTAAHLGLSGQPRPAPWPMLARLPRGPELSKAAASVLRDGTPA